MEEAQGEHGVFLGVGNGPEILAGVLWGSAWAKAARKSRQGTTQARVRLIRLRDLRGMGGFKVASRIQVSKNRS